MHLKLVKAAALLWLHCGRAVGLETPHRRSYFYVGGRYVDDGAGGHLFQDQIPSGAAPWRPGAGLDEPSAFSAEYIQQRFTAPRDYLLWPQAALHTQWPGNGAMGDPVFDAFYSSGVQYINNATYQQAAVQAAGAALLDRIGKPAIVMGHSQGGIMPPLIADARPNLTRAVVLLEPSGPPFQDVAPAVAKPARAWGLADIPLTYSPAVARPEVELLKETFAARDENHTACVLQAESPAPRRLTNLAEIPILTVTAEASFHAVYDECNVRYLRQAGCSRVDHVELSDVGIHGNGHMFFMETNSDEVQELVHSWILNITSVE
ncbi:putative fusarubin cluster-esterase [Apiospora sp. TS-2023a]